MEATRRSAPPNTRAAITHPDLLHDLAIWALCLVAVVGILARPFRVPEWIWALGCAAAVAILGLVPLGASGRITLAGIGVTAAALVIASGLGANLGAVTLVCGAVVFVAVALVDRAAALPVVRGISWTVLLLVAGLFVLVAAAEQTGLLDATRAATALATGWPAPLAIAAAAFATGIGSNLINNLPAGLIAGTTVAGAHVSDAFRSAVAIGIDLGPNLSVTGSLATILWLLALRREEIEVDAWRFLRVGAVAMPAALLVAVESLLITQR